MAGYLDVSLDLRCEVLTIGNSPSHVFSTVDVTNLWVLYRPTIRGRPFVKRLNLNSDGCHLG
jgi:hypothetical protein